MASSVLVIALALLAAASAAPERLSGGEPIDIEEFPYVVSLVYTYRPEVTVQRCVGSLISSWHVLTTAFCFHESTLSAFLIRAGSSNSMSGGSTTTFSSVTLHPEYTATPLANDVAVALLSAPMAITGTVGVLYLPPEGFVVAEGTSARVVSWGFEPTGTQLEYLKSIYLDKVNLEDCARSYADTEDAPEISESGVICASSPGRGICRGDSGAPMAIGPTIVGIGSHFNECGSNDLPDVFTRVDTYTNWILSVASAPGKEGVHVRTAPVY